MVAKAAPVTGQLWPLAKLLVRYFCNLFSGDKISIRFLKISVLIHKIYVNRMSKFQKVAITITEVTVK